MYIVEVKPDSKKINLNISAESKEIADEVASRAFLKEKANEIHHLDKTKTNHDPNNFMVLCHKCHTSNFHRQKRQTSKFIRLYGKTINDLALSLKFSKTWIFHLHKKDLLKNLLIA